MQHACQLLRSKLPHLFIWGAVSLFAMPGSATELDTRLPAAPTPLFANRPINQQPALIEVHGLDSAVDQHTAAAPGPIVPECPAGTVRFGFDCSDPSNPQSPMLRVR